MKFLAIGDTVCYCQVSVNDESFSSLKEILIWHCNKYVPVLLDILTALKMIQNYFDTSWKNCAISMNDVSGI